MTAPWRRAGAYWLVSVGSQWRTILVLSVISPLVYLAGLGFGVGTLVGGVPGWTGVSYPEFVAPGLLAAIAMLTATSAGTWPVITARLWRRTYEAQLATPLRPVDVFAGHAAAVVARVGATVVIFWSVLLAAGLVGLPWGLAAVPAAMLTGLASGVPLMALSVRLRSGHYLVLVFRFVLVPMFLLGGVFAPVDRLPAAVQAVVRLTPLWHGTELCRAATAGPSAVPGGWGAGDAALHVGVLLAFAVAGTAMAVRGYRRMVA